jgi:heme A synthase
VLACVGAAVLAQYALGVTTLLMVVPVPVATLHQAGAVALLTAMLVLTHCLSAPPRLRINASPPPETLV